MDGWKLGQLYSEPRKIKRNFFMCTGTHEHACSNNKHLNDEVPHASLPARFDLIPLNHVIQTTQTFFPFLLSRFLFVDCIHIYN